MLHIGTNNNVNGTLRTVLDKLLTLKSFAEKTLPDINVCNSNLTLGTDNTKTSLTVNNLNKHFSTLQLVIIGNSNIVNAAFGRGGLHLNSQGFGKLAISFIKKIKNFERSWQAGGSFRKKFFDCDFSRKSEISCSKVEDSRNSDPNLFRS